MAGLFIKLDCDYWDHPKVVQAGVMAGVLYLRMSAYCMQHTTDGFVPAAQLPRFALPATGRLTLALFDAGLIEQAEGGWLLPGYLERYPSSAELERRRQVGIENGRKGGRPRNQTETPRGSEMETQRVSKHEPRKNQEVEVEVEVEVEPPPPAPSNTPSETADSPLAVAVADQLLLDAGIVNEIAGPDERSYVARAIAHGWPVDNLRDLAREAGARNDVESPRDYLRGGLKKRANTKPPAPSDPANGPAAWAMRGPDGRSSAEVAAATYVPYQPEPAA